MKKKGWNATYGVTIRKVVGHFTVQILTTSLKLRISGSDRINEGGGTVEEPTEVVSGPWYIASGTLVGRYSSQVGGLRAMCSPRTKAVARRPLCRPSDRWLFQTW